MTVVAQLHLGSLLRFFLYYSRVRKKMQFPVGPL